jgi:hypothetical protein
LSCHDGRLARDKTEFRDGIHRTISCEACHGNGLAHIRSGGRDGGLLMANPGRSSQDTAHEICATCHSEEVDGFTMSPHFTSGANTCNDCHDVHKRLGMIPDSSKPDRLDIPGFMQLCQSCHEEQAGGFMESGHAQMDVAVCGSCHDFHQERMFRLNPTDNSTCLQCHGSEFMEFSAEGDLNRHTGGFHPVDPAGSGASRCIGCHMPPWNQTNQDAGPHDHSLWTVAPIVSNQEADAGINPVSPNSCAGTVGCHDANDPASGMAYDVNNPAHNIELQALYEIIGRVKEEPL